MEADSHVCLRWNNHQSTVVSVFETLLDSGTLVDCTVAAEGRCLQAHRVILSSCSPFFALLFSQHYEKHPIVVLKDIKFQELRAVVDYMYRGEVDVAQDRLGALLQAAKSLQIKGLSEDDEGSVEADKSKETYTSVPSSGASAECSEKPRTIANCPSDTEVVDLSDDSLPSPCTQETPSTEQNRPLVDCVPRMLQNFPPRHENKMRNATSTNENYPSTVHDTSDDPQIGSTVSALTVTPSTSTAVSEPVTENNRPEVRDNSTARIKCENTLLPKATVSVPPPERTTVTLKAPLQKPEVHVKSESEVMDTADDFAEDISRDFTFSDVDYTEDRERQSPLDGINFLGKGMSIERVVDWTRNVYSALPQSKRPSFSRCRACGKVYKYKRNLIKHLKYECGKDPQFQCPCCPARYTQNGTLRKHLEKHHQS